MNCQGEICINLCNVRGNSGGEDQQIVKMREGHMRTALMAGGGREGRKPVAAIGNLPSPQLPRRNAEVPNRGELS